MLIRDHFQNFKSYQLPKAQLIIADVADSDGGRLTGKEHGQTQTEWFADFKPDFATKEALYKQFNPDI